MEDFTLVDMNGVDKILEIPLSMKQRTANYNLWKDYEVESKHKLHILTVMKVWIPVEVLV